MINSDHFIAAVLFTIVIEFVTCSGLAILGVIMETYMKTWIKAIVIDVSMLWCMAAAYLNIGGVGDLAENAIGFLGALCLVVGIIWLFDYKRSAANKVSSGLYKVRSPAYLKYRSITAGLKIALAAALGWPWVASGFLVAFIAGRAELAEVNRLIADK